MFAVPILPRLGAIGVSTHACWIAALQLAVIAVIVDGSDAVRMPTVSEAFAIGYLAIVLTAVAFVLWYAAVQSVGPATAGLFAGLIPIVAAFTGIIPGLTTVTFNVLGGVAMVGAGIAIGLTSGQLKEVRS